VRRDAAPAFAKLSTTLHIPLTLMLIGIVLRGSAFAFRAYHGGEESAMQLRWGRVFAIASAVAHLGLRRTTVRARLETWGLPCRPA
jgi:cytochrome bd-type quinol oxidase subunit 2